jgi:hypothetical protein
VTPKNRGPWADQRGREDKGVPTSWRPSGTGLARKILDGRGVASPGMAPAVEDEVSRKRTFISKHGSVLRDRNTIYGKAFAEAIREGARRRQRHGETCSASARDGVFGTHRHGRGGGNASPTRYPATAGRLATADE